jgi:hypothetical protein
MLFRILLERRERTPEGLKEESLTGLSNETDAAAIKGEFRPPLVLKS